MSQFFFLLFDQLLGLNIEKFSYYNLAFFYIIFIEEGKRRRKEEERRNRLKKNLKREMNRVRHTCFVYVHTSALKKKAKNSKRIAKEWKWCERKFKWLLMTSPAGSIDLTCLFNNFVHVCSLFYLVVNLVVKLFFKTYTVHKLMMIMITCLNVWIIFFLNFSLFDLSFKHFLLCPFACPYSHPHGVAEVKHTHTLHTCIFLFYFNFPRSTRYTNER